MHKKSLSPISIAALSTFSLMAFTPELLGTMPPAPATKLKPQKKDSPYTEDEIETLNSFGNTSPERKKKAQFRKSLQAKYKK